MSACQHLGKRTEFTNLRRCLALALWYQAIEWEEKAILPDDTIVFCPAILWKIDQAIHSMAMHGWEDGGGLCSFSGFVVMFIPSGAVATEVYFQD